MEQDGPQIEYAEGFENLVTVLKSVKQPGSYCTSGVMPAPMPLLLVAGVGAVSFPVPVEQCRCLIHEAAAKAPYGRGSETLLDESVRKVWQVDAGKISLGGSSWENTLSDLLAKVASGLGCPLSEITAEFYKLLIYEQGGFFSAHRDSEKAGGMFGTLVVSLPSAHKGGRLHIRHLGQDTAVDLINDDPGLLSFAAFYADCEHEILPVESGYRVCLVFNLIQKRRNKKKRLRPPHHQTQIEKTRNILKKWLSKVGKGADKLVWMLNHHYTPAGLSFAGLKNRDAAVAQVLSEAARTAGCSIHLGIVHLEESGWAQWEGDYHQRRRYWDDEEDEDDYSIGEVCEWRYYIDSWRDQDDALENYGEIPLENGEALPPGALEGEDADEKHFYEATGNEGASFERTYLRAACVLWAHERTDDICLSAGLDAALGLLEQRIATYLNDCAGTISGLAQLTHKIVARWERGDKPGLRLKRFYKAINQLDDAAIIKALPAHFLTDHYTGAQNEEIIRSFSIIGHKSALKRINALLKVNAHQHPAACIDLWTLLAASDHTPILEDTLGALLDGLLLRTTKPQSQSTRWVSPEDDNEPDIILDLLWNCNQEDEEDAKAPDITPDLLRKFLEAIQTSPAGPMIDRAVALIAKDNRFFDPETILLPALQSLTAATDSLPPAIVFYLWRETAKYFLERAEQPPIPPSDWAMPVDFAANSNLLRELATFVRDPNSREHRFRARKDLRKTIHQTLDGKHLDITHVTERRGSPYTLVCKKTLGAYKRACKAYRGHIAAIEKLCAMPIGQIDEGRDWRQRLMAAQCNFANWKPARTPKNVKPS